MFDISEDTIANKDEVYNPKKGERPLLAINPDEFKHDALSLFTKEDHPSAKFMDSHQDQHHTLSAVVETMAQAMKENKHWPGALGPVAAAHKDFDKGCLDKIEFEAEEGASSWVMSCRKNSRRFGLAAWPLPGIATVFQALEVMQYVMITYAEDILKEGIVLANFEKFVTNMSGWEWLKLHSFVVVVPAKAFLYLPYGWLAQPVHLVLKEDQGVAEVAYGWALPLLSKTWFEELPAEVRLAIQVFNTDHMVKQSASFWKGTC